MNNNREPCWKKNRTSRPADGLVYDRVTLLMPSYLVSSGAQHPPAYLPAFAAVLTPPHSASDAAPQTVKLAVSACIALCKHAPRALDCVSAAACKVHSCRLSKRRRPVYIMNGNPRVPCEIWPRRRLGGNPPMSSQRLHEFVAGWKCSVAGRVSTLAQTAVVFTTTTLGAARLRAHFLWLSGRRIHFE